MIAYKRKGTAHKVYLDNKHIGAIRPVADGYKYFPKGQDEGGETFRSIMEVKRDIEGE